MIPLRRWKQSGKPYLWKDTYENFDLKQALNALSKEDKAVVELRYFEDMKLEEISEILEENISTVKSRLYRQPEKAESKAGGT